MGNCVVQLGEESDPELALNPFADVPVKAAGAVHPLQSLDPTEFASCIHDCCSAAPALSAYRIPVAANLQPDPYSATHLAVAPLTPPKLPLYFAKVVANMYPLLFVA